MPFTLVKLYPVFERREGIRRLGRKCISLGIRRVVLASRMARQVSKGRNAVLLATGPRAWSNAGLPKWSDVAVG